MAPVVRSAFTSAQRSALAELAELAARTPALRPAYARARELVLEGSSAKAAAGLAIAEADRLERLDPREPDRRVGRDRRRPS